MNKTSRPSISAHDLRYVPQCAALDLAVCALETSIRALVAAHPGIDDPDAFSKCTPPHLESIADLALWQARALIQTLHRYQLLALNPSMDFPAANDDLF